MHKPVLAIDCDGVLADWMGHVIPIANDLFGLNIQFSDLISWDLYDIIKDPSAKTKLYNHLNQTNMVLDMKPYQSALEGFAKIKDIAEIYVVTSPMMNYPNWIIHRNAWLKKYYGIDKNNIVYTPAKHLIQADVFIDDKPETVIKWARHHPYDKAICWKQSFVPFDNNHDELNICHSDNWDDVVRFIGYANGEIPF